MSINNIDYIALGKKKRQNLTETHSTLPFTTIIQTPFGKKKKEAKWSGRHSHTYNVKF